MLSTPMTFHPPRPGARRPCWISLALACVWAMSPSALGDGAAPAPAPTQTAPTQTAPGPAQPAATVPDLSGDGQFLERCKAAAKYARERDGEGVVIMLDGKVVYEEAQGDWPLDRPHPLASGTKSFSGIAAALAVHDGLLTLDERVSDTITEWKTDPEKSKVTVRQVLSLCAGIDARQDGLEAFRKGEKSKVMDHAKDAIDAALVAKPGEKFIYSSASFYIFGELMKRKLNAAGSEHENVVEYLQARVMDPLGIRLLIGKDAAGNPNLPGGGLLSARDWLKFGELIRHNGRLGDKQIIDEKLLAELFVPSATNPNYGLTWWLLRARGENPEDGLRRDELSRRGVLGERLRERLRRRNQQHSAQGPAAALGLDQLGVMAAGLGKQRLYVLPELKLTVVRLGNLRSTSDYEDQVFLQTLILGEGKPAAEPPR